MSKDAILLTRTDFTYKQLLRGEFGKNENQLLKKYPKDLNTYFTIKILNFFTYVEDTYSNTKFNHNELYHLTYMPGQHFSNISEQWNDFTFVFKFDDIEVHWSKLKRIKNYLRMTMSQEKLVGLSILNKEHDKLRTVCFNDIIDLFSTVKSRKKNVMILMFLTCI